jgi:Mor family transcriptional regulator
MTPNLDRNRRIFAAFEAGRSTEQLSKEYALTDARIRAILTDERHKRSVSPHPFYRGLRGLSTVMQT